jgi:UDP-3-O-[3-hydroxymyristoyl] glucosamine N-acyltransferase
LAEAYDCRSSVLVIGEDMKLHEPVSASTLIRVKHPYACFAEVLKKFNHRHPEEKKGVSEKAAVADSAEVGSNTFIGNFTHIGNNVTISNNAKIFPNTYIGDNVDIGENTIIYGGVNIYEDTEIGADCIIHSGVTIGSDGYGYVPDEKGQFHKIPQIGKVILKDNVEIGANSTIDRGTLGATLIHEGVKLDNLVQIAHNVEVGENTVIAAQTGVSGSTKIGKNCMIGGQVGLVGHISIANGTKINAKSGVSKSVKQPNTAINGIPAFNYRDSLKSRALFRKLPDLEAKVRHLEQEITRITNEQ